MERIRKVISIDGDGVARNTTIPLKMNSYDTRQDGPL
jgi:hypothetical protein